MVLFRLRLSSRDPAYRQDRFFAAWPPANPTRINYHLFHKNSVETVDTLVKSMLGYFRGNYKDLREVRRAVRDDAALGVAVVSLLPPCC